MNSLHVWIMIRPGEWENWALTFSTREICETAKLAFASLHPYIFQTEAKYIQMIYEFGGGAGLMYYGCY